MRPCLKRILANILLANVVALMLQPTISADQQQSHDYRNNQLGIVLRYPGLIQPVVQKTNEDTGLVVPLTQRDYLYISQSPFSADDIMNATAEDIKKGIGAKSDVWELAEKSTFLGYPAWHLRFTSKGKSDDQWLVARDSTTFQIGCAFGTVSPGDSAKELCKNTLVSIRFLGGRNANPELYTGSTWHVAPPSPDTHRPAVILRWEDLPLLPSRGSTQAEWTEEFTHTIKGLLQQAGAEVSSLQVVIQNSQCGPHGIACVEGPIKEDRRLKFIYSRRRAAESLASPDGRAFIWYVLLHETHHVLEWKEQGTRLENVFRKVLQAQVGELGIKTDFNVQCLDATHAVAIPATELSQVDEKRIAVLAQKLYPPIAEADEAAEEIFADAYAVKQWSALFGSATPVELRDQVLGYLNMNLMRLQKALARLQRDAPAARRVVEADLETLARENVDELTPPSEKANNEAQNGWKVYESADFGVRLKYPPSWILEDPPKDKSVTFFYKYPNGDNAFVGIEFADDATTRKLLKHRNYTALNNNEERWTPFKRHGVDVLEVDRWGRQKGNPQNFAYLFQPNNVPVMMIFAASNSVADQAKPILRAIASTVVPIRNRHGSVTDYDELQMQNR